MAEQQLQTGFLFDQTAPRHAFLNVANLTVAGGSTGDVLTKQADGTAKYEAGGGGAVTLDSGVIETGSTTVSGSNGVGTYGVDWEVVNERITWQRVGDVVTGGVVFEIDDGPSGSVVVNNTYTVTLELPVASDFGNDRGLQGVISGDTIAGNSRWSGTIGSDFGASNEMNCTCFIETGSVRHRFSGTFSYDVQAGGGGGGGGDT